MFEESTKSKDRILPNSQGSNWLESACPDSGKLQAKLAHFLQIVENELYFLAQIYIRHIFIDL